MSDFEQRGQRKSLGSLPGWALPVILGLLGVGVLCLAVMGVAGLVMFRVYGPAPGFEPEVSGAPAIEVEQPSIDLGTLQFNTLAEATFEIRNVGDEPLRILSVPDVEALEGC